MGLCKVALADDHVLIRNALAALINTFENFSVIYQADNGARLIEKIKVSEAPDIVLLDINMPVKDGYDTALWLKEHHPTIKILALSMYDNELAVIRMLKNGARGYILKDAEPQELKDALEILRSKDYYYSDRVTGVLIHSFTEDSSKKKTDPALQMNEREITFLKHACSELSYKEIADLMYLSPRTVDGYRDALFLKLNVKTRVGLVLYAIKNRIVDV
jgi:two-component system invasion response regulator UvrY